MRTMVFNGRHGSTKAKWWNAETISANMGMNHADHVCKVVATAIAVVPKRVRNLAIAPFIANIINWPKAIKPASHLFREVS